MDLGDSYRLQFKRMEQEVSDARSRVRALQEAKDKLDNEWAENFGAWFEPRPAARARW